MLFWCSSTTLKKRKRYNTCMKWLIVAMLAVLLTACASQPENILDINLKDHNKLALHIHPILQIEINGQQQMIPANIGISSEGMRVIHTHDATGTLHVESPTPHQFYLQDFFTIWGKEFSDQCIFQHCENETHDLKMYVNGEESGLFGALPLRDKDIIRIVYEER